MADYKYELKQGTFQVKETDPDGTVVFYGSRFNNVDDDGDIITPGAFSKTIKENKSRVRYLYQHRTDQQLGVILDLKEDDTGLLVHAVLNLNKEIAKNTLEDYRMSLKYGRPSEHSIGFYAIKTDGEGPRYIREAMLKEVSYVTWGANPDAILLSVKQGDVCFLDKCLKEGNYTENYHDKLFALRSEAAQALEREQAAAQDDLIEFYNLLKL
jgi:HK97 family phage prohead protease